MEWSAELIFSGDKTQASGAPKILGIVRTIRKAQIKILAASVSFMYKNYVTDFLYIYDMYIKILNRDYQYVCYNC